MKINLKNIGYFIFFQLIVFFAGGVGSYFTFPAIGSWYKTLNKPFFNPPNWIFGPVWTILYIMMAISVFLYWKTKTKSNKKNGFQLFFCQLIFNSLWSIVFFGLHSPLLGFIVIIILWSLIVATIKHFSKINDLSSKLLYLYLAWVSFATILNLSVALLN